MAKEARGSYGSPRWSSELLDCSMPVTFDTYNRCGYDCLYCFSFFQKSHSMGRGGTRKGKHDYQRVPLASVDVDKVKRLFTLEGNTQMVRELTDYIGERRPVQWGGLGDPFDENERKHGVTLELMRFFKEINYPLSFSTKATWWVSDSRYKKLIKGQDNWHFKFSIINMNAALAKKIEKGVPIPEDRLSAMARLARYATGGITLRLRPFIIGMSDVDKEHLRLIRLAAKRGADSVSTEFMCLERRADARLKTRFAEMSKALGYDITRFYVKHSPGQSGYLRMTRAIKQGFVDEMDELCQKLGLRFYVSDAHFKERCANGSCCGLAERYNYTRGQYTEALLIARRNGTVRWSDIAESAKYLDKIGYSHKINESSMVLNRARRLHFTLYDYMHWHWNTPNSGRSPYKYFGGVLVPDGLDDEGNIIYKYNRQYEPWPTTTEPKP